MSVFYIKEAFKSLATLSKRLIQFWKSKYICLTYWSPYWFVFDSKGTAPILISKQWIKLLSIILFRSPENIDLNSIIEATETSKINLSTVNRNTRYLWSYCDHNGIYAKPFKISKFIRFLTSTLLHHIE